MHVGLTRFHLLFVPISSLDLRTYKGLDLDLQSELSGAPIVLIT